MSDINNKFFLFNEDDLYIFKELSQRKTKDLANKLKREAKASLDLNIKLTKDEAETLLTICDFVNDSKSYEEKIIEQISFETLMYESRKKSATKASARLGEIYKFFNFTRDKFDKFSVQMSYNFYVKGKIEQEWDQFERLSPHDKREATALINEFKGKTVVGNTRTRGAPRKQVLKKDEISIIRAHKIAVSLVRIFHGFQSDAAVEQMLKRAKKVN